MADPRQLPETRARPPKAVSIGGRDTLRPATNPHVLPKHRHLEVVQVGAGEAARKREQRGRRSTAPLLPLTAVPETIFVRVQNTKRVCSGGPLRIDLMAESHVRPIHSRLTEC